MKSEFETWPATPVEASLEINEVTFALDLSAVASFKEREQPGSAGHPRAGTRCQISDVSILISDI